MYNEEKVVIKTITNLLDICYPDLSVIVIDDGSLDGSHRIVTDHFGNNPRVKIIQQGNMGKSAALNKAMSISESDIVVCIDADTLVNPNIIDKILPHFEDENVAAVSGYVKVGNRVNWLTEIQYIEYITIQNHERKLFEPINGILVVPGALGAFRRSAVLDVGGFTVDTLAEDCDISIRMLCNNYTIRNACEAISFTEAPHMTGLFLKQRVRWTVGLVQGLFKHRSLLLNHPNQALSLIVIPYTWIYRIILPLLLPLLDYFFFYTFIVLQEFDLLYFYLSIVLFDVLISYFILKQQKEPVNLIRLIFIRLFYKHLTLATYISIFKRWLNGNLFRWGTIPRQGSVKIE
jgi:cellulose synthase/poly-beta-1,6-N-acetylglucosamine synthase-like glycosyltransferase